MPLNCASVTDVLKIFVLYMLICEIFVNLQKIVIKYYFFLNQFQLKSF